MQNLLLLGNIRILVVLNQESQVIDICQFSRCEEVVKSLFDETEEIGLVQEHQQRSEMIIHNGRNKDIEVSAYGVIIHLLNAYLLV